MSQNSQPEYHRHEEYRNRIEKLESIRSLGIDPYPASFHPKDFSARLKEQYQDKEIGHSDDAAAGSTPSAQVAGRMVLFRAMGKNAFAQLQDSTGRIQVMFNREATQVDGFSPTTDLASAIKFIEKRIDLGDIIGVEGHLFYTQLGELTIFAKRVTVLCKSLLPLPDKHSGLADKGVRYRKRWLDLIVNPDVTQQFKMRSQILRLVRHYFDTHGFMEVETPVLQTTYGGAQAKPFTTHLNALHQDMFLRISLELPLKKLIIGGFNRVYEIGKVFRNEGIDRTHNPEFTMIEIYGAYLDYKDVMVLTENLFEEIALKLFGTTEIKHSTDNGEEILVDLKAPWKRISMKDSIKEYGDIDVDALSNHEIDEILLKIPGLDKKKVHKSNRGLKIALLFEEFVEKHLIQPHHIIDHPIETTPLCKLHRDPALKQERIVERFETFILGREFCNAYSELNDPVLQRELLEEQARLKLEGDEEANPLDEEFIEAICQGMPPTGGLGIGIDRLVMLFTNAPSIRDVIFFPVMKPEEA